MADPMQLSIPQARQWLIHGAADEVVPPAFSRDYVAKKQKLTGKDKEDVHLVEIESADHFDLIDPPAAERGAAALATHQAVSDRYRENYKIQVVRHEERFAAV